MSRCILLLVALVFFLFSQAQIINIEEQRLNSDEQGWKGNIDLNAKFTKNTRTIWQLSNKISIQYRKEKFTHLFLNDISLVRSDQNDLVNYGYAHYRYTHLITKNRFLKSESYAQIQYNSVQKIRQRVLVGTGLRFKVISTDSVYLSYGWSFMYEYEETTLPEYSNSIRNSNYVSFDWKINKYWDFKTITYYQPSIADFSDFRISNESSISHRLTEHISILLNVNLLYDSHPPIDVPVNNFSSGIMLRYKF